MTEFPDIELALIALFGDLGTCGTVTPPDLGSHLPYIRIERTGGGDDLITDTARISIDAFATTREGSYSLAAQVRQRLVAVPPPVASGVVIDRAVCTSAPMEVPWGDPAIHRRVAVYSVAFRR